MLEQRDLSVLKEMMESVIMEHVPRIIEEQVPRIIEEQVPRIIEEQVPRIIEEQVPRILEERVPQMIDERLSRTEDFLLDEIGRTQAYLERKIDKIANDVEALKVGYRINQLDYETVTLLQHNVTELDRRVCVLEGKMA